MEDMEKNMMPEEAQDSMENKNDTPMEYKVDGQDNVITKGDEEIQSTLNQVENPDDMQKAA